MKTIKKEARKSNIRYNTLVVIVILILLLFLLWNHGNSGYAIFDVLVKPFYLTNEIGRLFLSIVAQININSPQNITYTFNKSDNFTIDLNVSSKRNITSWNYTLIDVRHNLTVNNSVAFYPNSTIHAVRWENYLLVKGVDIAGNVLNSSVYFFVHINNSAPVIKDARTPLYICEDDSLYNYYFNISDDDEYLLEVLASPLWPDSPFYIFGLSRLNLTNWRSEIFSGAITKDDVGGVNNGSREIIVQISASDGLNIATKDINITLIERNQVPVISNIGVQTVWNRGENTTFMNQTRVYDVESGTNEDGNFTYNITFSNNTLFNISTNGSMFFDARGYPTGVHYITACAIDGGLKNPHPKIQLACYENGGNKTGCNSFSLTITDENRRPRIINYYPLNLSFKVSGNDVLLFNITKYDPDGTIPDTYWYVDNLIKEYDRNSSIDRFVYSFPCGVSGIHNITAYVTDGLLSTSLTWTIDVTLANCPTILPPERSEGGGSPPIRFCSEKWGCSEWGECYSFLSGSSVGKINSNMTKSIKLNCTLLNYSSESCGFSKRICKDINFCNTTMSKPGEFKACRYTEKPTCDDGIRNCHDGSCEILTDCGGTCAPCPTCSDGIQNQGEEKIDCGGPCDICYEESPALKAIKKSAVYVIAAVFSSAVLVILVLALIYVKYRRKLRETLEQTKGLKDL